MADNRMMNKTGSSGNLEISSGNAENEESKSLMSSTDNAAVESPSSSSGPSPMSALDAIATKPSGFSSLLATATTGNNFKLLLLLLMVLQNSSLVLIGRYTRTVPKEELYSVNHLIFTCESLKFILSAGLEYHTTKGLLLQSVQTHVLDRPLDALKISIPALLYLLQNTLLYVALSNLSAPLFQVTYQCKLVTTALVSVVLLDRKYKFQQWICLFVLSIGVAVVVLGERKESKKENDDGTMTQSQSLVLGLISVGIACFSSALAGVYFEKVIKKPTPTTITTPDGKVIEDTTVPPASLWMRNMQLAFYSLFIAFFQGLIEKSKADPDDVNDVNNKEYFFGFTTYVWMVVWLQAGGGLLVAAVIKYADNVLKGLATGVSVVVATTFSIIFLGTAISFQFVFGATMILGSVYIFSNPVAMNTKSIPFMAGNSQDN